MTSSNKHNSLAKYFLTGKHSILDKDKKAQSKKSSSTIEDEAERMLAGIEGTRFALRASENPEDLDPSDVGEPRYNAAGKSESDAFDATGEQGNPALEIEQTQLDLVQKAEEEQVQEAASRLTHLHLRNILLLVLLLLLIIALIVGVSIWRNSMSVDTGEPDTDALSTDNASSGQPQFEPVLDENIPELLTYFGSRPKKLRRAFGHVLIFGDKLVKVDDDSMPKVKYELDGELSNAAAETTANIALCFNKKKRLIYVYALYDLDALGVASASFEELGASDVVAKSLLSAMGLSEAALDASALDTNADPDALLSTGSLTQSYFFTGSTLLKKKPRSWQLTETYDFSLGETMGDNSVLRSCLIELM